MIPWWHPVLGDEEAARVAEVIASGFPNDGAVTEEFATRIAELAGRRYGVGVSSGTAAIYCALVASGVGEGDEVVVPDLTFVATANAVRLAGARPVLADVDPRTFCLDAAAAAAAITDRTRAILPVHVNGRGGSIEAIAELAAERGLAMVEDAAEALGSSVAGRPLGSFGDAAAFSFTPTKLITTGQGGVVVTDDPGIARCVRELKDQGRAERGTGGADEHPVFGFNFKLTNVQAAIGLAQLERLPERLDHLARLRAWYEEELDGLEPDVVLPPLDRDGGEALQWIDMLVPGRDELVAQLTELGIETRTFWHPVHAHTPYRVEDGFPNATTASAHGLWLPSALTLTREDVRTVCSTIREFVEARRGLQVTG